MESDGRDGTPPPWDQRGDCLGSSGNRRVPFAYQRQHLIAKAFYVGDEVDKGQEQAANARIPLERRNQLGYGLVRAVQDGEAHESQVAFLDRRRQTIQEM